MIFKDWRICDTNPVELGLDKSRAYYLHAQAWHLKGYLGGTHSWCAFWSDEHQQWLVVELTDAETVSYQRAKILHSNISVEDYPTKHSPMITTREPTQRWFGHNPIIVDSCLRLFTYSDVVEACKEYPITEFILTKQNCNTFTSYLIWKLNLNWRRPFRSVGFKNKPHWQSI